MLDWNFYPRLDEVYPRFGVVYPRLSTVYPRFNLFLTNTKHFLHYFSPIKNTNKIQLDDFVSVFIIDFRIFLVYVAFYFHSEQSLVQFFSLLYTLNLLIYKQKVNQPSNSLRAEKRIFAVNSITQSAPKKHVLSFLGAAFISSTPVSQNL